MKPIALIGVVLIVLGGASLVLGQITYTTQKPIIDVGPLKASVAEEHSLALPEMAGFGLIVLGGLLVVLNRRDS
jgi:hypothetical protein